MSERRHRRWRWFLATALALSMHSFAAHAKVAYVDERTDGNASETARGGVVLSNSRSLVDMSVLALQRMIYVDANAPGDSFPGNPNIGDPDEDGTPDHPFDSVFEAMAVASDGDTILVAPGRYASVDASNNRLEFAGRNIQLRSYFEEDFTQIERTVLDATIVFDGTESPDCELAGFKIQGPAFAGIFGNGTAATLRNCVIQGNRTCDGSVLTDFYGAMANCLIADNTSTFECGSRSTVANFSGTMTNCTIANNATGISVHAADMVNCIFYYNDGRTIYVQNQGSLGVSHCNIQGGEQAIVASETETLQLASIMALYPRFVRLGVWENGQLEEGDYHLKSQGLRWSPEPVADSHWVRDAVTSPCIDAGDPSLDIGAEAVGFPSGMGVQSRVNWRINMGCYGGTAQASLPLVGQVVGITATASGSDKEDAGPERTCDGSGIDAQDQHSTEAKTMWLSDDSDEICWIQYEFNRTYVLYEMWVWNYNTQFELMLGFGVKDVTIEYSENGTDWTVLGDVQFAQASARADYAANTIVDLGGISARYIRLEIRSGWGVMGRFGLSEVRFFADLTPRSEPGLSYVLVLDTFEAYTDNSADLIYEVWLDGWVNETGSTVGHPTPPFAEREIVNSGQQSMPLFYDNTLPPFYSEAYRELEAEMQDWYVGEADALTLYFHGGTDQDHNIDTDRLYVAVEDDRSRIAVVHHPDPEALLSDDWQEWTIRFEEFDDVDLHHVQCLTLGIGDRNDPQSGGSSVVYIDDIGLSICPAQTDVVYPITNVVATSNAISDEETGPENTVNGSGLNANNEHSTKATDMWLVKLEGGPVYIQYEFDDVYELREMWVWNYNVIFEAILGFGVKEVIIEHSVNGTNWTILGDAQLAQATAMADYTANTVVPLGGVSAKYIRLTIRSGWGPLGQAGLSEVRFFTSQAPSSTIWSYTLFLDSFETYTASADPNTVIDRVWIDGRQNETGAQVGYPPPPFTEREIVNSGLQAMPLFYNNRWSPFYSETYRDLEAELQDWRAGEAEALTLYFHGSMDQDHNVETDSLYVAVEDDQGRIAVVHHPDPEALLSNDWQEWTIRFEEFGDVDLSHVERLILGVGDRNDPQPGGSSVVYIDDIGLSVRVLETNAGQ